jgi:hypothetical protein
MSKSQIGTLFLYLDQKNPQAYVEFTEVLMQNYQLEYNNKLQFKTPHIL